MRGFFAISTSSILGGVCDIQNWSFCDYRLFALAVSRTRKRDIPKIFVANNTGGNNIRAFGAIDNNIGIKKRIKNPFFISRNDI